MKLSIKQLTLIAFLAVILFVQEEVLTFLPNIQLTIFLLVLYGKKLSLKENVLIIVIHVLLDNLVMGSFNMLYMPFMLIGWLVIPISLHTIFKEVNDTIPLAFLGILFSLIYSWLYIIPNVLVLHVNFTHYLMADILFEVVLAGSSFLSILLLYEPCSKVFDHLNRS
ncbi:MAG: hypothetical protein HUJ56_06735 [Erysipelotrichaceae bacterium]|nr:hypothetical protein [Erysipelotrichaceae bacterium]